MKLDDYLNRRVFDGGRASAIAAHEPYEQYEGYFNGDEWGVVEFRRTYRTKGGVHFHAGDRALARVSDMPRAELLRDFGTAVAYDVYDPTTTHVCLVLAEDVRRFFAREDWS